ncbi:hypothetical protein BGZ83_002899, partial [Gryganskiella cystojenkinii]
KRFSRPDQVTRHRRTHLSPAEKAALLGTKSETKGNAPGGARKRQATETAAATSSDDGGEEGDVDEDDDGEEDA